MERLDLPALARLAKRALRNWVSDAAPSMGAALAFYAVLSLAPLLLVAVGIAGFLIGHDEAQNALVTQLSTLLGEKAAYGIEALLDAAGTRDGGLLPALIGLATMIAGATTVFMELRVDLDRIWGQPAARTGGVGKMLLGRFFSFLLVAGIGALLLLSFVASTVVATLGGAWLGRSDLAMHAAEFFTSFVVVTLLFALIYKLLPSKRIAWSDVWVGAAVTSVLFWAGKFVIALYIAHSAVDSRFGAAGALVVVILWVYYSSQVFFLGAEFTKEYAIHHGSRKRAPASLASMNADYDSLVARAQQIVEGKDPVVTRRDRKAA